MIPDKGKNVFRLNCLPSGWKACLLNEAISIKGGSQPPKKVFKTEPEEGFVRLVQIRDYKSDNYKTYVPRNSTKKFCSVEDIMIGRYGPPVFQILRGIEGAYNVALMKAEPLENMNRDFLFHLLSSPPLQNLVIENSQRTAGQTGVNLKLLNSCIIPLPPLYQQKQIANILDTTDTYRQKTKALVTKYDQLIQSLFLEMFGDPVTNPKGWEQNTLGNLLEITSSKRIFKDEYVDHGIPFYRTKEIVELSKGNNISLELFISEARYAEIKSKYDLPAIGDILLSAVGTIGIMWTVDTNKPFYFKDGNLVWLKSSILEEVNPTYLRMTLEHLIEYEKYKLAEGGAYNALTIAKLKDFNVLLAPFKLQNQFAERVKAIEAQKALAQQELDKADELFNSLLQKAFKGELTK